ncbi:FG-GAP-like repeat-containing protein [Winogradskyella sp. UBA3174]|uniref:FG-GAP-like repeat-containing protein n=1 Tax=Winogradskyella sp. UBA3174 TaxID=1947785 RepID=UPI0025EFD021|nr:FG-GAP-like repeat-containing protein [Winogradskyella sp. UBA3174]|tara:strand:- start:19566 stop:22577 length:3012 start_codon:yes stop_codon:yes gene_type:complete
MKKITLLLTLLLSCFFASAQTTVDCAVGPTNTTYCYTDSDTTNFVFTSSNGADLRVTFNTGQVEVNFDELIVLDTNGTELYNGYGNNGDLAGLTFQSAGDTITVSINSDTSINCSGNNYIPWDFDVTCSTCTNPTASYTIVNDCAASNGFLVDVNISDFGSASSLTISDNQSSATQSLNAIGTIQFGPYLNATDVVINIQNDQDVNCSVNSGGITQSNCPPQGPVGVTCASESSTFIFTEEFDLDSGWTGDLNSGNGSWEIPNDSGSGGTGPDNAFSGSNFMNYEASGNSTITASAISPAIDLSTATDGAELSFYMHANGDDMGTLNVNVGTSVGGPFTTVFSQTGELQTSGSEAWVPVGINLDAYLGQVVYVEFSHTGTGTGFEGDMSIDYIRVETCGSFCIAPSSIVVSAVTQTTATVSWVSNNGESNWEYIVQTSGTGIPTGSGAATSIESVNLTALDPGIVYEVYVRAICGSDTSIWGGPLVFSTSNPPPPATFTSSNVPTSGTQRAAVDMNGDFLDDVVSIGTTNVNIFYQQISGGLSTTATNIGTTSADNSPSWSLAAADYDRNGYTDLLYGGGSGVTFMKANATGTGFTETSGSEYVFSQRSNFADINNDGNLDAFVCHDVDANVYYINDGNGNLSYGQGDLGLVRGNYGSIWIDYDNDRDLDMFIAKCGGGPINQLFTNNGDGTYTDTAPAQGLDDGMQTWSSAWGDFDNDGDMDTYIGASSGVSKLLRNDGNGVFVEVTAASGVLDLTATGIENCTHDFDNDGNLDIASNGNILFGNGNMTFSVYENILSGNNGSFGDMNNDGFIDTISGGTLLTNNANSNNWVKITTTGVQSNINGIGARVEVHTASGIQIRDVRSGEGFRFMSSLNTHFGIGTDTTIINIVIYWPSGIVDNITNPSVNTHHIIIEGQNVLNIEDETFENINIYPNPVGKLININSPINLIGKVATIFNIEGKRVINLKLEQHSIDVSTLSQGNYILRLESDGKVLTKKFIKR